jgi:hypothetical protein
MANDVTGKLVMAKVTNVSNGVFAVTSVLAAAQSNGGIVG